MAIVDNMYKYKIYRLTVEIRYNRLELQVPINNCFSLLYLFSNQEEIILTEREVFHHRLNVRRQLS